MPVHESKSVWFVALSGVLLLRAAVGLALIFMLAPVCIDDAFRAFYAIWWWQHPSFYPLPHWPPGYFWVYGLVLGPTGDAIIAPRILTLAIHLFGVVIILLDPETGTCRVPAEARLAGVRTGGWLDPHETPPPGGWSWLLLLR